jgi:hypothetical protein
MAFRILIYGTAYFTLDPLSRINTTTGGEYNSNHRLRFLSFSVINDNLTKA